MSFLINPFAFAVAGGDFESIATVTVGSGGASSIQFTSIPSTFAHLQIRIVSRDTRATTYNNVQLQLNSDTGSNYAAHALYGDGSSAQVQALTGQTSASGGGASASNNATANIFGAGVVDILDYASSTKNTVVRSLVGVDLNGNGAAVIRSALWLSTSTVSSVTLFPQTSGAFAQHSTAALYGVNAP